HDSAADDHRGETGNAARTHRAARPDCDLCPDVPATGSCTRSLRIIPLPLKPATMPHLTMPERGQYHGFTPFLLPTRSVGPRVALRAAACCRVSPRGSDTIDRDAPQAQKQTTQRAETLSWPDAQAALCPVCPRDRASPSASSGTPRPNGADEQAAS